MRDKTNTVTATTNESGGYNLLQLKPVQRVLKSGWFPKILQIPVAAVFGFIAYELIAGPQSAHENPGTALMWVLWWPLIPIMFLLIGRFWCAICPFGTLSDFVQKFVGVNKPVPRFLKLYGIWLIDGMFILITWADHVFGIVASPWGSGVLLLLITLAVIVSGAFFQRRTFCRYLCFLGGLSGNYARAGMLSLRANPDICATCTSKAACYNGTEKIAGCPLFSFPRTMDSSANCSLCFNCVKSCPNDAIVLTVRPPTKELWFIRNPKIEESFLAMAIMGIVLVQNITMLELWQKLLVNVSKVTGIANGAVSFTLLFIIGVLLPVGMLFLASKVASFTGSEGVLKGFARFGYALIPLDMAGHISHNLFHLLAEGKSVFYSVVNTFGGSAQGSAALVSAGWITFLQYLILGLGLIGSLYAVSRIGRKVKPVGKKSFSTTLPYVIVVLVLTGLNVLLFSFPMAHRM